MAFLQKLGSIAKRSAGSGSSLLQAVRCMSSSKVFIGGSETSLSPVLLTCFHVPREKIFVVQ
jgi:hypothetical protein